MTFAFTTATGNPAGVKFECALTPGAKADNASAAYKACTSPTTFDDLADGAYTFSVRAQGEDSADSRSFVKVCQQISSAGLVSLYKIIRRWRRGSAYVFACGHVFIVSARLPKLAWDAGSGLLLTGVPGASAKIGNSDIL